MSDSRTETLQALRQWAQQLSVRAALSAMIVLCAPLSAQEVHVPKAYAPYAFLIGEWDVGLEGNAPAAVTRFLWGPNKTFIRYSGALLVKGKEEPNWEGILVWNGVRHTLDMLLVLDQSTGDLVQEQGSVSHEPDGSVVRDITVYYSEAALYHLTGRGRPATRAQRLTSVTSSRVSVPAGYTPPFSGRVLTGGSPPSLAAMPSSW